MSTTITDLIINKFKSRISEMLAKACNNDLDLSITDGASTSLSLPILITQYKKALTDIEEHKLHKNEIGYYVKRDQTHINAIDDPERSYAVICTRSDYNLILEVKSKLPDNQKRVIKKKSGSSKKASACYRIDDGITPKIALTSTYMKAHSKCKTLIENRLLEEEHNNLLASIHPNFIHMQTIIEEYDDKTKFRTYMDFKEYDLGQLLMNDEAATYKIFGLNRTKIKIDSFEIQFWKIDIIYKILQTVKIIHEQELCHGDLKPKNILCELNQNTGLFDIFIIDFGATTKFGCTEATKNTTGHFAPPEWWINSVISSNESSGKTKLTPAKISDLLNNLHHNKFYPGLDKAKNMPINILENYTQYTNTGQHDMWSLGILITEIAKISIGELTLKKNIFYNFMDELLNENCDKRLNITTAIAKFEPIMLIAQQQNAACSESEKTSPYLQCVRSNVILDLINQMHTNAISFCKRKFTQCNIFKTNILTIHHYLLSSYELIKTPIYLNQIKDTICINYNKIASYDTKISNQNYKEFLKAILNMLDTHKKKITDILKSSVNASVSTQLRVSTDQWVEKNSIIHILDYLEQIVLMLTAAFEKNENGITQSYNIIFSQHKQLVKEEESHKRKTFDIKYGCPY